MVLAQFARFMGVKSFEVSNHARAAVLPRNDMFLLDMSRSMYRDNYLRDNLVDGGGAVISGTASEFAVRLRPEFQAALSMGNLGCATIRQATQVCCFYACFGGRAELGECSTCRADPSCRHQSEKAPPAVPTNIELIESGSGYSRDFTKYSNLINPAPALPLPRNTDHFSANYRCVQSPNALNAQEYYLIDFNNPSAASSTFGARPEPLFSVLEATNFALKTLRQRGMTVDKTGLIAFDNEASNLIPTNPRVLLPDTPGSSQFNAFENATNILNAGTMNTGFLSKALFPKPGAYSDIFQALREAAYKISLEPTYQVAKNSITIFTDGLQNCVYASAPGGWWDGWIRTGSCVNSGTQIIAGIRNLGDPGFVEELTRRQIAVNMILFGEDVGAHRLIRKNNAGNGCRDQVEDNASPDASKPFVDANWGFYGNVKTTDAAKNAEFASASATNPFLAPNQLYNSLVAPTKGLWLPVLPQLMDSNGDPVIFWNELQAACTGATDNSALGSLALTVSASTYTDITDINGRLRYDPLGQSVSDQMKRFMDQIIQSPYVLVP